MQNELLRRLGITVPIVQAPMGRLATPRLAAAVSAAGGLGMLGVSWDSIDRLKAKIAETRALGAGAFGVNLCLEWDMTERLETALEEGVGIVSFFWGDPGRLARRAKDAGAVVLATVDGSEAARRALDDGADILVAQGWEAGGHVRSSVGGLTLIPAVVDAAGGAPVIAAGGIADGRGMAAALVLGASGVWLGTRFLLAEECDAHPHYVARLLEADEQATLLTTRFGAGWQDAPHRVIRTPVAAGEQVSPNPVGFDRRTGAAVPAYTIMTPHAQLDGEIDALPLYAGQSAGLISSVQPVSTIIADMMRDAAQALEAASRP